MSADRWRCFILQVALTIISLILLSCPYVWGKANFRAIEKRILDSIIGQGRYDSRIRPMGINNTDGPCVVRINIYLRSISRIDDLSM